MARWQEGALSFVLIGSILLMGGYALAGGVLICFYDSAAHFPTLLLLGLLGVSLMVVWPLVRRLIPDSRSLFGYEDAVAPRARLGPRLWLAWFVVLSMSLPMAFLGANQWDSNRPAMLGWSGVWGVSLLLGYRFIPTARQRQAQQQDRPTGGEIYLEDD